MRRPGRFDRAVCMSSRHCDRRYSGAWCDRPL